VEAPHTGSVTVVKGLDYRTQGIDASLAANGAYRQSLLTHLTQWQFYLQKFGAKLLTA
jgi:hypothetical protein